MDPLIALAIKLPPRSSRARRTALHHQLRAAILDGRLKPGLRLPSTRALAATYAVSRNTAVAAYDLLLSEGYLSARRGSGTSIAASLPQAVRGGADLGGGRAHHLPAHWHRSRRKALPDAPGAPRIVFRVGSPDHKAFPYISWHRLSGHVMRRFHAGLRLALEPQGLPALREAIAQHVSFARAVACGPDDILVTAGAQQAFDLLARVLASRQRTTVALENPGYPPLRAAFAVHGARIVPVPIDDEGLVVERLPQTTNIICVTPSHQFPLGAVMSARRRTELLDFSYQRGCLVIEDDYDGEFRFADRPLDALQTLDRAGRVFYVGTFSKCLLPGIRLGYVVAPAWARAALIAAKRVADGWCNIQSQATLALLIKEGHLARHVRKMQRVYAQRRQLVLDGLSSGFARWLTPLPSLAGLHVTAKLAGPWTELSVVNRARAVGVGVSALRPFFVGRPSLRGLLFGYGDIDERAILEGLRLLQGAMPLS